MLQNLTKDPKKQKSIFVAIMLMIIIPSILVFTEPKQAQAQFAVVESGPAGVAAGTTAGATSALSLFERVVKEAAMRAARILINNITQSTINWINTGNFGNPFYLTNQESYFKDIVKFEVRNLVDIYAYNKAKFPFGKQFAINTINSYQRKLEDNAAYSLSNVIKDQAYLDSYRSDFNVGGWEGFLINTQYPQNNYIGFTMIANEDLARKVDKTSTTAAEKVQDTLDKSQGFLAPQTCTDNNGNNAYNKVLKNQFVRPSFDSAKWQKENPVSACGYQSSSNTDQTNKDIAACVEGWNRRFQAAKDKWNETNGCKNLATTTPGAVVSNQIMEAMSSKIDQPELAAAMGNSFSAILDAVFNKLFDKAKGLLGSSTTQAQPVAPPLGGDTDDPCTGGNPKCTCVENNSSYNVYEDAVATAQSTAYPNGFPSGTPPTQIQTAICAAYTGPGACGPSSQEDEIIISGLPVPYVTVSMDILIGGNPYTSFSSRSVAACEAGVQSTAPTTPTSPTTQTLVVMVSPITQCSDICYAPSGLGPTFLDSSKIGACLTGCAQASTPVGQTTVRTVTVPQCSSICTSNNADKAQLCTANCTAVGNDNIN